MKRTLFFTLYVTILSCLIVAPAQAHYVYLQPQGQITATIGEQVTVGVYLHADSNDVIYGWGVSQVFDTTELSRTSYAWGSSPLGSLGDVLYSPVEDYWATDYTFLSRYDWNMGGNSGSPLTSGSDYELFNVTYTFSAGEFDGFDIWVDWNVGEDVFFNLKSYSAGELPPIVGTGPDYGSNAVPIPGAVWLLGSGVVALVGLKRRTSH